MATMEKGGSFRYLIDYPSLPPLETPPSPHTLSPEDMRWKHHMHDQWRTYATNLGDMIVRRLGFAPLAPNCARSEADVIIRLNPAQEPLALEAPKTLSLFTTSLPGERMDLAHLVIMSTAKLARLGLPAWDQDALYVHTLPSNLSPRIAHEAAQSLLSPLLSPEPKRKTKVRAFLLGPVSDPAWQEGAVLQKIEDIIAENPKDLFLYVPTGLLQPTDEHIILTKLPQAKDWLAKLPPGVSPKAAALGLADEIITTGNASSLISDVVACLQKDPQIPRQHIPALRVLHNWPLGGIGGKLKNRTSLSVHIEDFGERLADWTRSKDAPFETVSLSPLGTLAGKNHDQRLTENLRLGGIAGPLNSSRIKRPVWIRSGWREALDAIAEAAQRVAQGEPPLRPRNAPHFHELTTEEILAMK